MADNLFVYGTLHPDRAPSEIADAVRQFRSVGEGTIRGRIYRFGDYPAVKLDSKNGSRVRGQIFQVPNEETLRKLDEYEEFDPASGEKSLFWRRRVRVRLNDATTLDCWVYEYNKSLPASGRKRKGARVPRKSSGPRTLAAAV